MENNNGFYSSAYLLFWSVFVIIGLSYMFLLFVGGGS